MNINNFFNKVKGKRATDLAQEFKTLVADVVSYANENDIDSDKYYVDINKSIEKNGEINIWVRLIEATPEQDKPDVVEIQWMYTKKSRKKPMLVNYIEELNNLKKFEGIKDLLDSIKKNALIEKR